MDNPGITFIGCGNMGRSLIGGLLANGYDQSLLTGIDPDPEQRKMVDSQFSIRCVAECQASDIEAGFIILAVKPQVMQKTLEGLSGLFTNSHPAVISIAAGIRVADITQWLDKDIAVARVMPNTPSLIRAGATGMFANEHVSGSQRSQIEGIMSSVGKAIWVDDEDLINAVTALSGSGPAYFFLFVQILQDCAANLGLPEGQARALAIQTALGSARMLDEGSLDPATLRAQVTSPGGTTESALNILMAGEFETIIQKALIAARDRSRELASGSGEKD